MRLFLVLIMLLFCGCDEESKLILPSSYSGKAEKAEIKITMEKPDIPEVKIGQIWDYFPEPNNPFVDHKIPRVKYKVLDIKDGFVKYEIIFRDSEGYFDLCGKYPYIGSMDIKTFLINQKLSKYEVR